MLADNKYMQSVPDTYRSAIRRSVEDENPPSPGLRSNRLRMQSWLVGRLYLLRSVRFVAVASPSASSSSVLGDFVGGACFWGISLI